MNQDPVAVERHQREAVAAASLNHPNVATIYEVGESPSGPFIAMEYVEGLTLRDVLCSGSVSQPVLLAWASQVADALAAAHAVGIVHRDVKPENIMIAGDHRAVVLDFGIARHVTLGAASESRLTMEGSLVGSVQYQAPEVLKGSDASPASDVFALGVILYEMATGRVPFDGSNTFAILNAIVSVEPTLPSELNPDVGAELEGIIAGAMAKEPDARFRDAAQLSSELRRVIGTPGQNIEQLERGAPLTNLPSQVTRFIGRAGELTALGGALAEGRLVTVTGPGGSGKTRLAQELARARIPEYPGGRVVRRAFDGRGGWRGRGSDRGGAGRACACRWPVAGGRGQRARGARCPAPARQLRARHRGGRARNGDAPLPRSSVARTGDEPRAAGDSGGVRLADPLRWVFRPRRCPMRTLVKSTRRSSFLRQGPTEQVGLHADR